MRVKKGLPFLEAKIERVGFQKQRGFMPYNDSMQLKFTEKV